MNDHGGIMLFNRSRAVKFMRDAGLDVLIASSTVNVSYFSDFFVWIDPLFKEYMATPGASSNLGQSFAVFPIEGEPALIIAPTFSWNAAESWTKDLRFHGEFGLDYSLFTAPSNDLEKRFVTLLRDNPRYGSATEALATVLEERRLTNARIGLDAEPLPSGIREEIQSRVPRATVRNCSNLIRLIRSVKSSEEIARLTHSAEINETVAMETLRLARPGMPANDLIRHFRIGAAEGEAEFDHFALGPKGLAIYSEPGYRLEASDIHYADWGCIYRHYFSDSATTLALSELSQPMLNKYEVLRTCIESGASRMRPGVKSSEIQATMMDIMNESGMKGSYPHGHGLGLEVRDYPIIAPNNGLRIKDDCIDVPSDLPMEEGMINNLEVSVWMPVVGSIAVERSFLVTPEGARSLVNQDRSAPVVAGRA
jgi:Xaa-Pro aminopeptidase